MLNESPVQSHGNDMERNAYNAAFHELGFRWHWDSETYTELLRRSSNPADRLDQYLKARQPHLLKAYDAAFLVDAIQAKKAQHEQRESASTAAAGRQFDWSDTLGGELGA